MKNEVQIFTTNVLSGHDFQISLYLTIINLVSKYI